jgi:dolichol-phosphate mannosyltransferase
MNPQASYAIKSENVEGVGGFSFTGNLGPYAPYIKGNIDVKSDVGVILPTYCEAADIGQLINEIEALSQRVSILVIDDSSPDGTANIVRCLQKRYDNILLFSRPIKNGLGTAITDGFKIFLSLKNPPAHIVTMDADYSHNPHDIPKLISALQCGYDLAIGSRYCRGGNTLNWSVMRLAVSKVANLIASVVIGAKLCDYTSGMRCYSIGLIRSIIGELHSQTYEIQIETIRQAHMQKFKIKEVPITFANRKKGKSKLTFNEIRQFVSHIFFKQLLK